MKIIQLSFNNIHNLKGPHVISFDELPLKSAGIFAIIGPTGSGKSTILDVITLALFNRIPRFNSPISKAKMNDLGSVMTHYTNSAEASIIYEVNGNRYTSTWSISKARTGNLKDYEMSISDANGNYLDLKRSEVPSKNEKIIGLKYDQFVKSIILSQGQFSRFLKANKNERGELLENITGTGIYRKIGRAAYTKYKEIEKLVSAQKQFVKEIITLSDEERRDIHIEYKKIEQDKLIADKFINALNKSKRIKQDLVNLDQKLKAKLLEQSNLHAEIIGFSSKQKQLDFHDLLIPLKGDIALYQDAEKNKIQLEKNIIKTQQSLIVAQEGLVNVMDKMTVLTSQQVDTLNFKLIMSSFEKEVNNMDKDLGFLKSKGIEIRDRINKKIHLSNLDLNKKISSQKAIAMLDVQLSELILNLQVAKISKDENAHEITKLIKRKRESLEELKELHSFNQQLSKLEGKELAEEDILKVAQKNIDDLQPIEEKSQQLVEVLTQNIKNLNLRKVAALKIASLEQLRGELIEGASCPLCGSLDHPYSKHLEEEESTEINRMIKENELSLQSESTNLKATSIGIVQAKEKLKIAEKTLIYVRSEILKIKNDIKQISQKTDSFENLEVEQVESKIEACQKELKILEAAILALQLLKINEELNVGYTELSEVHNNYGILSERRKKRFQGKDVAKNCNELLDEFTIYDLQKAKCEHSIELETASLHDVGIIVSEKSTLLQSNFKNLGIESIDQMIELSLSDGDYATIKRTKEALVSRTTSLVAEMKTLEQDQKKTKELDEEPHTALNKIVIDLSDSEMQRDNFHTRIGELTSNLKHDDSLRKNKIDREGEIKKLNKRLEKWAFLNKMIGDLTGNKFANFAQGLTLKNLLVYTNKRLVNLTDRYLLDKPKDDGTLLVVDQYQGNTLRSVSTLSGGETFLISLALALSLSDMSSKNVSLDSLFIDEGFGTLDQETLDVALDALERLQSESQKMVGVISHVEALKERINVQIKLKKNAQGYSQLKVEG